MIRFDHIDEANLAKKFEVNELCFKSKEYYFVIDIKEEEYEEEFTDTIYCLRFSPLSSDIKEEKDRHEIRYNIGLYRLAMKKKGSQTTKKKEELIGEEWRAYGDEAFRKLIHYINCHKDTLNVTFDYGIFELASRYALKDIINFDNKRQSTVLWDEFKVTADIGSFRNDEWDISSKSNLNLIKSLI